MVDSILEKIVNSRRLPVLFVGSGLSKRYLHNYPTWDELLNLSYAKIGKDPFQLEKYRDQFRRQGLSPFDINIRLATIIENEFNAAFFDRKIKLDRVKNPEWVKRGISPYKMYLSRYFRGMKLHNSPKNDMELTLLRSLKSKISAVITTNYDEFLEKQIFSTDFRVFVHQNELFSADSYNIAEMYKIHGSVRDANSIIITEEDYSHFEESRKLIIAKMLTLFADSPIIFLGYSFTDENIQKIITEFLGCLTHKELSNIEEHFIFISYKASEQNLIEIKRTITTKNNIDIPITEIQTDNFSKIYETLNGITPGISPARIRETRRLVKTIVDQNVASHEAESIIVGIDDLSKIDLSSKPLAIAIGYKENILNRFGYGLLADDLIFEDILYNNKNFNADQMCMERFKSISISRLLPVYKYIKNSETWRRNPKLIVYYEKHRTIDLLIPSNIKKQIANVPLIQDYNELLVEISAVPDINKKSGLLLKNLKNCTIEQTRCICKDLFSIDREAAMKSTHFKRCVMYIDMCENL